MYCVKEDVLMFLLKTLKTKFHINSHNLENYHSSFFDNKIGMTFRDMVYLFHIAENEFKIRFTEDDIDNAEFYTILGFSKIVCDRLGV